MDSQAPGWTDVRYLSKVPSTYPLSGCTRWKPWKTPARSEHEIWGGQRYRGMRYQTHLRELLALRALGADAATGHFGFKLALGLHVVVDLVAELVRLGGIEVDLLLQDVGEAAGGHPAVVEVLHQDEGVHGGELGGVVHGLHDRYSSPEAP